jgi:endoglucanase
VLEAPLEGDWAPPAQSYYFDDYASVGLQWVRIPVRWDNHTMTAPPYTINATWMARVQQVVGWSLAHGFPTIINTHHDDWLDTTTDFAAQLPRFQAIWQQVATAFANASDLLMFERCARPQEDEGGGCCRWIVCHCTPALCPVCSGACAVTMSRTS